MPLIQLISRYRCYYVGGQHLHTDAGDDSEHCGCGCGDRVAAERVRIYR